VSGTDRGRREEGSIDSRIVSALERISVAFRVMLWDVAKERQLSPIQIQFLIHLEGRRSDDRRVSRLARDFGLTQATVSDAVSVLVAKGLLSKRPDPRDGRVSLLTLTAAGKRTVKRLSKWTSLIRARLRSFPRGQREAVMLFLMELVESLHAAGVISAGRMCIVCAHLRRNTHPGSKKPDTCELTGRRMGPADFKLDCERHEAIVT